MTLKEKNEFTVYYLKTEYSLLLPEKQLWISPLSENAEFSKFLRDNNIKNWAMVTPCNPASKPLPEAENKQRLKDFEQKELFAGVNRAKKYFYLNSVSRPDPEPGFFIGNIFPWEAVRLGFKYGQNAILVGRDDGYIELVWCTHPSSMYTVYPSTL